MFLGKWANKVIITRKEGVELYCVLTTLQKLPVGILLSQGKWRLRYSILACFTVLSFTKCKNMHKDSFHRATEFDVWYCPLQKFSWWLMFSHTCETEIFLISWIRRGAIHLLYAERHLVPWRNSIGNSPSSLHRKSLWKGWSRSLNSRCRVYNYRYPASIPSIPYRKCQLWRFSNL